MTNPQYPIYIVSKGRADTMMTSRALAKNKMPHYITVEPQDYEPYTEALKTFKLEDHATLLTLPFSNHGDGPGRARNWAWDHSMEIGAEKHWVMDDNIEAFYRLHKNMRIRVGSGAFFKACEDFIDRFENIPVSGLQYRFFCAADQYYPPYVLNTRIYSCLLIDNKCEFRWRGRWNEDTDLSLRVLKSGKCTLQFNFLLQGKAATQTLKGGNTEEFYDKDALPEKYGTGKERKKEDGTYLKSKMLCDMHPDVSKLVFRYGRWHHYVDYAPFKGIKLKLKPEIDLAKFAKINDYGVTLIDNYTEDL